MGYATQFILRKYHIIPSYTAADTNSVPTYENDEAMIPTLQQHLHMSDLLHHDDDNEIDPDGPNDIDVSRMVPKGTANSDYTIGGHPEFKNKCDNY